MTAPQFHHGERRRQDDTGCHAAPDHRVRPPAHRRFHDTEHENRDAPPISTAPIQSIGVAVSSREERMVHVQMNRTMATR